MFDKVFNHLKGKGVKVFAPGQHKGLCKESYVVIKESGTSAYPGTNKLGYTILDVMIFHPISQYSTLSDYVKSIKGYLKEIKDLRYGGNESPDVIDDEKQAHTRSIQYQVQKKL